MHIESLSRLTGEKEALWYSVLARAGLTPDGGWEQTVLLWDDTELIAAGSRQENLLKYLAVDPFRQGEGLLSTVVTALRQEAFRQGHRHLFLYTKPTNEYLFSSLLFYPVAQTDSVLLMEDRKHGISDFLDTLPLHAVSGPVGAAVMNCDPFTLGHRYLIETAARECAQLYVFVLSEDKGRFSAKDRMEMVRLGTEDLTNVTVLPTGPYLISGATFPTYFLKDREQAQQIHCRLDIEIFCRYFAPRLGITRRYVGTEPLSPTTDLYNDELRQHLPPRGIYVRQIPRLTKEGIPVSASAVRKALSEGNLTAIGSLVPNSTFTYLQQNNLI